MKRRILALILCLALLLPTFLVFASAEAENKYVTQGYAEGADEFVNVEKYVENAGKSGYDELCGLGISSPYIVETSKGPMVVYDIVLYNPNLIAFDTNKSSFAWCFVNISKDGEVTRSEISATFPSGSTYDKKSPDSMFIRLSMYIAAPDKLFNGSITFDSFNYLTNSEAKGFLLNAKTEYKDIDSAIPYTSAVTDLCYFRDATADELVSAYKQSSSETPSLLVMYDSGYGTDNYTVYAYLYTPDASAPKQFRAKLYQNDNNGGAFVEKTFELLNNDGTLSKYRMLDPSHCMGSTSDYAIRNYYVGEITVNGKGYIGNWTFRCHEMVLPEDYEESFVYTYTNYISDDDMFFGDMFAGETSLNPNYGDKFKIYYNYKEYTTLEVVSPYLEEIGSGDGWIEVEVVKHVPNNAFGVLITEIKAHSNVPYVAPLASINVNYAYFADGSEVLYEDAMEGPIRSNNCEYTPLNRTTYSMFKARSNTSYPTYLQVNTEEVIKLDLHSAYYRLDNSVTANNMYQTLQSVYFTMPNSFLGLGDLNPLDNRTVTAIEYEYASAMMAPGIYTVDSDFYNYLSGYVGNLGELTAKEDCILSTYPELMTGTASDTSSSYSCDILIGDEMFGSLTYTMVYHGDKYYDNIYYLFNGDEYYEVFEEVFSAEELLAAIKGNEHFDGEFTFGRYVLHDTDTKKLTSIYDMSFGDMVDEFGWWNAFWFNLTGTTQTFNKSIEGIEAILTLSGSELDVALSYDDTKFSTEYYVSENEVEAVKEQMANAKKNNEAFVFLRFDVYDYYAAKLYKNGTEVPNSFIFQGKYYDNFDVISIEATGLFDTKVYSVECEPIDIAPAVTSDKELDTDQILSPSNPDFYNPGNWNGKWWEQLQEIFKNIGIVLGVALAIPVIIFIVWLVKGIIGIFTNNNKKKRRK